MGLELVSPDGTRAMTDLKIRTGGAWREIEVPVPEGVSEVGVALRWHYVDLDFYDGDFQGGGSVAISSVVVL